MFLFEDDVVTQARKVKLNILCFLRAFSMLLSTAVPLTTVTAGPAFLQTCGWAPSPRRSEGTYCQWALPSGGLAFTSPSIPMWSPLPLPRVHTRAGCHIQRTESPRRLPEQRDGMASASPGITGVLQVSSTALQTARSTATAKMLHQRRAQPSAHKLPH